MGAKTGKTDVVQILVDRLCGQSRRASQIADLRKAIKNLLFDGLDD